MTYTSCVKMCLRGRAIAPYSPRGSLYLRMSSQGSDEASPQPPPTRGGRRRGRRERGLRGGRRQAPARASKPRRPARRAVGRQRRGHRRLHPSPATSQSPGQRRRGRQPGATAAPPAGLDDLDGGGGGAPTRGSSRGAAAARAADGRDPPSPPAGDAASAGCSPDAAASWEPAWATSRGVLQPADGAGRRQHG